MDKPRPALTLSLSILLVLAIVAARPIHGHAEEPAPADSKAAARALPYMAFRSFRHEERFNRQFADAGIRLVFIYPANTICSLGIPYTQYPPNWIGPDRYNWDALDRQINDVLAWNPGAKLMCMIDLNTPPWWIESHGGAESFRTFGHVAARDDYRRDVKEYLRNFLEHTETHHQDKIAAYSIAGGMTCEWQDTSRGTPSPSKQAAFARWLGKPGAVIPADRLRASRTPFYDPVADADSIAYWRFSASLVADRILEFAEEAQTTIRHRVPLGCFFGYVMEHNRGRLLYEGHLSYDRVFDSPHLDFFTSPASYMDRRAGGTGGFMTCIDSILSREKSAWLELDHITHLLKDGSANGRPIPGHDSAFRNEAETVGALRREFAMCLVRGVHVWWFDMFGGWFDSPSLMAEIERMREIGDRFGGKSRLRAEVAVLVDADSMYYVDGHSALARPVLAEQRSTLSRMGAPWEIYSLADLPRLDTSRYRMVVLPNLFAMTPQKRAWLDDKVFRDGKHVVFAYAPGVITDGRYDLTNVEKLTGIPIDSLPEVAGPARVTYKASDDWTSVLVSTPCIPSAVLRSIARKAGVHVYCDRPDALYANHDDLLAVHTGEEGGKRTFTLPRPAGVVELFSGRVVSEQPVEQFTDEVPPMSTHLYHLTPPGAPSVRGHRPGRGQVHAFGSRPARKTASVGRKMDQPPAGPRLVGSNFP